MIADSCVLLAANILIDLNQAALGRHFKAVMVFFERFVVCVMICWFGDDEFFLWLIPELRLGGCEVNSI